VAPYPAMSLASTRQVKAPFLSLARYLQVKTT